MRFLTAVTMLLVLCCFAQAQQNNVRGRGNTVVNNFGGGVGASAGVVRANAFANTHPAGGTRANFFPSNAAFFPSHNYGASRSFFFPSAGLGYASASFAGLSYGASYYAPQTTYYVPPPPQATYYTPQATYALDYGASYGTAPLYAPAPPQVLEETIITRTYGQQQPAQAGAYRTYGLCR